MSTLQFLGPQGALPRFPNEWELRTLGSQQRPSHLDGFSIHAWGATDRLWLLDPHFIEQGYHGLLAALEGSKVREIRLITEPAGDKTRRLQQIQATADLAWNVGRPSTSQVPAPTTIEWIDELRRRTYPYAHDRFVLLDDALWHFGHAACGSGNCLSAASGPWSANDTDAVAFFEHLWMRMRP
jgi:hypothetical protein